MVLVTGEWLPTPYLETPNGILGLAVLIIYIVFFALLGYGLAHHLGNIRPRRWLLIIGLCLVAAIVGGLGNAFLKEAALWTQLEGYLDYPMLVPFLGLLLAMLAAIWINPAAAFLVALSFSIPYSIYHTNQVYDVFPPVFVAVLVAVLLQLQMEGRLYRWLRTPVIASVQGSILQVLLLAVTTFAVVSVSRSAISSTNSALLRASSDAIPLFVTAVVAGLVITLIRRWIPVSTQQGKPIWLPYSDNLNGRIITTFILITALLSFFIIVVAYGLARPAMTRSTVDKMVEQVQSTSRLVDEFQGPPLKLLEWAATDIGSVTGAGTENGQSIHDLELLIGSFESITVLDQNESVQAHFPESDLHLRSEGELAAVSQVMTTGSTAIIPVDSENPDETLVSFIVNVAPENGEDGVIIGRVSDQEIRGVLESLKFDLPGTYAFVNYKDGDFAILPQSVSGLPEADKITEIPLSEDSFSGDSSGIVAALNSSEREFIQFTLEGFGEEWDVGLIVAKDEILASGLNLLGQGVFIFALGLLFATVMILLIVDSASHVLHQITRQTHHAATMGIESPMNPVGNGDEIGGLAKAFRRLQMAYKQQWEEQQLLLEVSEEIATTFDLHRGMPTILGAAVKGVAAAGARIIVARNVDNKMLRFTQPQDIESGFDFDNQLLRAMQERTDLICRTPDEVRTNLAIEDESQALPQAMAVITLKTDDQHQGLICVWRNDSTRWKASQLRFLRTLASNASALIANAKLLATVENGRRRLSAIISSTDDAVLATNESNQVMLLNSAMEHYFGITSQEVLGRNLESVLENYDLIDALTGNGTNPSRIEVTASDGVVLDGQVSSLNYNGGNSAGAVVVLRDVTRFKQLDEMKTDFVANVSHDLRSPLTQMLNYSQLIPMDGPLTENQAKWLSRVERAVFDMTDLIEVLLDLNRLESGIALVTVPFRIEEIFLGIVDEYDEAATSNGLSLTYEVDDFLPVIEGDVDMVRQAIRNIVSNAIKYAPDSGDLTMSAEVVEEDLVICVADNGPGLAESDVTRVFEKFFRTEAQNDGKVAGRGLGLALVKSIAERHGGRAWCESQPTVGSRFYITLPVNPIGRESS